VQAAPIYRTLGELYWNYLELEPQAKEYYSKAVELADSEDIEEKIAAQNGLGQIEAALGNKDAAVRWLTQALAGYQALGDSERVSKLENQLKPLTSQ
jgi:tetratricopeptide (TPR) repeat protein